MYSPILLCCLREPLFFSVNEKGALSRKSSRAAQFQHGQCQEQAFLWSLFQRSFSLLHKVNHLEQKKQFSILALSVLFSALKFPDIHFLLVLMVLITCEFLVCIIMKPTRTFLVACSTTALQQQVSITIHLNWTQYTSLRYIYLFCDSLLILHTHLVSLSYAGYPANFVT